MPQNPFQLPFPKSVPKPQPPIELDNLTDSQGSLDLKDRRPEATEFANYSGKYSKSAIDRIVAAARYFKIDPNLLLAVGMRENKLKDFQLRYSPIGGDEGTRILADYNSTHKSPIGNPDPVRKIKLDDLHRGANRAAGRIREDLNKYGDEPSAIQAYNGWGYNPVTKEKAVRGKEFPYYNRVKSLQLNMMQNDPDLQKFISKSR